MLTNCEQTTRARVRHNKLQSDGHRYHLGNVETKKENKNLCECNLLRYQSIQAGSQSAAIRNHTRERERERATIVQQHKNKTQLIYRCNDDARVWLEWHQCSSCCRMHANWATMAVASIAPIAKRSSMYQSSMNKRHFAQVDSAPSNRSALQLLHCNAHKKMYIIIIKIVFIWFAYKLPSFTRCFSPCKLHRLYSPCLSKVQCMQKKNGCLL